MLDFNIVLFLAVAFFASVYTLILSNNFMNYGVSKLGFLVSYRNMGFWTSAITIGIGWMWAPAFFISSFQAYTNGLTGLFWFSFGNILTLIAFSYGAQYIRDRVPDGFTFTGYIKERHGPSLHKVYLVAMVVISLVAICQLLVALSTTLAIVTGVNKLLLSSLCVGSVFLLSYRIGFRASVFADMIKFVAVYGVFGSLLAYLLYSGFVPNFAGIKGTGLELVGTSFSWMMFATFGAATTLSLLSTPWVDNSFTQAAYSIRERAQVGKVFRTGAFIFAGGIAFTGLIGFLGVNSGVVVPKGQELYTLIHIVDQMVGRWALIPLVFAIFAGLMSVIDSFMLSISSIIGHDLAEAKGWDEKKALRASRLSFVVVGAIAILVANSGVDLLYLFLLGSVIKSSIGLATAALVLRPHWFDPRIMAPTLIVSVLAALISYNVCAYFKVPDYQLWLAVTFCFGTPTIGLVASRLLPASRNRSGVAGT